VCPWILREYARAINASPGTVQCIPGLHPRVPSTGPVSLLRAKSHQIRLVCAVRRQKEKKKKIPSSSHSAPLARYTRLGDIFHECTYSQSDLLIKKKKFWKGKKKIVNLCCCCCWATAIAARELMVWGTCVAPSAVPPLAVPRGVPDAHSVQWCAHRCRILSQVPEADGRGSQGTVWAPLRLKAAKQSITTCDSVQRIRCPQGSVANRPWRTLISFHNIYTLDQKSNHVMYCSSKLSEATYPLLKIEFICSRS
jgi:hypothetical protein